MARVRRKYFNAEIRIYFDGEADYKVAQLCRSWVILQQRQECTALTVGSAQCSGYPEPEPRNVNELLEGFESVEGAFCFI